MRNIRTVIAAILLSCSFASHAALLEFNSPGTAIGATRDAWLAAAGIASPQYLVDFETGFSDGQNVSGVPGLFPGGLVIRDTSPDGLAAIEGTTGGIGGSNPVGGFALEQNEQPYLELDFSAAPVDYVAFRDIDHTGTSVIVTFVGGGTANVSFETTGGSGNSAEFFGLFRNDMPRIVRLQMDSSGDNIWGIDNIEYGASAVPLPAAVYLFGTAVAGLAGWRRKM